jgi:hypothetical protein
MHCDKKGEYDMMRKEHDGKRRSMKNKERKPRKKKD